MRLTGKWELVKPLLNLHNNKGQLLSYGEIAKRVTLTRQRVYQLAKRYGATEARRRKDECDTQQ